MFHVSLFFSEYYFSVAGMRRRLLARNAMGAVSTSDTCPVSMRTSPRRSDCLNLAYVIRQHHLVDSGNRRIFSGAQNLWVKFPAHTTFFLILFSRKPFWQITRRIFFQNIQQESCDPKNGTRARIIVRPHIQDRKAEVTIFGPMGLPGSMHEMCLTCSGESCSQTLKLTTRWCASLLMFASPSLIHRSPRDRLFHASDSCILAAQRSLHIFSGVQLSLRLSDVGTTTCPSLNGVCKS